MQIIINETNELTDLDIRTLRALTGDVTVIEKTAVTPVAKPVAEKAKKSTKVEKPAEEEDDDTLTPAEVEGATMSDAVEVATKLVSSGKSADVKAALADVGVKRVSELKSKDIAAFIEALTV